MRKEGSHRGKAFTSFEEFKTAFDECVEAAIKGRRTTSVLVLLRQGLAFALSGEQIRELLAMIHQLPGADSLEFAILLESRLKPAPNNALARLGPEIVANYIRETGFSTFIQKETKSTQTIHDWLQQLAQDTDQETRGGPVLSAARLRSAFGCLLLLIERPEFTEMVLRLLKFYSRKGVSSDGRKASSKPSYLFAKTIGALLIPGKPKSSQIKTLLSATDWLQQDLERLAEASRDQADRVDSLETRLAAANDELVRSKETVAELKRETENLTDQVKQLRAQLEAEGARAASTEEHWKQVVRQELAGFSFRVRKQLEHEVNEIRLCLERANPNVEMALHRVKRILSIIPTTESNA